MAQYYGQLVIGPSGSGKSTYCNAVKETAEALRREVHIFNLDPAAEYLPYIPFADLRELITLDDVMEELKLGPNGGLVYCMEYLLENIEWLEGKLAAAAPDDYFLFDCPGQLELYSHLDVMASISRRLVQGGFALVSVCLLDSTFLVDRMKFVSGCLVTLSFIVALALPALSVLSKCDLYPNRNTLRELVGNWAIDCSSEEDEEDERPKPERRDLASLAFNLSAENEESRQLNAALNSETRAAKELVNTPNEAEHFSIRRAALKDAFTTIVDDYSLVSLVLLDVTREQSLLEVVYRADGCIQYGENLEPREADYERAEARLMHGS